MRHSESVVNISKALLAAKAKMKAPTKDAQGQVGNQRYKYADLADVKESYDAPLTEQGLFVVHATAPVDGHVVLTTTLIHSSGEWLASDMPMPSFAKPQEFGSALTYYRRYGVCALLDIAPKGEDDDGKAAQDAKPAAKKATPAMPPDAPPPLTALISREEALEVHSAAKRAGVATLEALEPILENICGVRRAVSIPKAELGNVFDALAAMADHREVPA